MALRFGPPFVPTLPYHLRLTAVPDDRRRDASRSQSGDGRQKGTRTCNLGYESESYPDTVDARDAPERAPLR
jgi:hypothetical protein